MKSFQYLQPGSVEAALGLLARDPQGSIPFAGGSDLLGLMKRGVAHHETLVGLGGIAALRTCTESAQGLQIGSMVSIAALLEALPYTGPFGLLAQAAQSIATPEIRNQATVGGNLCQRPRCLVFRHPLLNCLKKGGTDCPAKQGPHQQELAVMGAQGCHATHPSDLAPALIALDARITIAGPAGSRELPLSDFFVGPEQDVSRETMLEPTELATGLSVPRPPAGWRGVHAKYRARTAGDFAILSITAGFGLEGGRIRHPRIVLGSLAPVPWRSPTAEALLRDGQPEQGLFAEAAQAAFAAARPLEHNGFKVAVGKTLLTRSLAAVAKEHQEIGS